MKFRPLHDRILVRRIEAEEKTVGGIIIPDTAKEKPQEGEVIAAGLARATTAVSSAARCQGGRPHSFRQMVRHRNQARWRGSPDYEGGRRFGCDRGRGRREEGRLADQHEHRNEYASEGVGKWLQRK